MDNTQPNYFDRSGAFYPIVMCYLYQLIGFKELVARSQYGEEAIASKVNRYLEKNRSYVSESEVGELLANAEKLCGPLRLRSEQHDTHIEIETDLISYDTASNIEYLASYMFVSAGQLFVTAFELMKESNANAYERLPIIEFLRHCRNAAAHGGKFDLRGKELHREAEWGKFTISEEVNGTPLFHRPDGSGMLGPGDPIRLLWDIEQAYPDMVPSKRVYGYLIE